MKNFRGPDSSGWSARNERTSSPKATTAGSNRKLTGTATLQNNLTAGEGLGDLTPHDLRGAVGHADAAHLLPGFGQPGLVGEPHGPVDLHGPVHDPHGHFRGK